jgi:alkenylglycerophosphocholine hydrolase
VTGAAFLLLTFGLCAAVVDWVAVFREAKVVEYVAKPLTLVLFIAAVLAMDPTDDTVRVWFVVALGFCLLGDVLLMIPKDWFVYGLGAFFFGHLAYIAGLQIAGRSGLWFVIGMAVVVGGVAAIGLRIIREVKVKQPELAVPVTAYIAVIAVMLASAFGTRNGFAMAGALLFCTSDGILAWNKFVNPNPLSKTAIIITYHLAQLGLVLSLVWGGWIAA